MPSSIRLTVSIVACSYSFWSCFRALVKVRPNPKIAAIPDTVPRNTAAITTAKIRIYFDLSTFSKPTTNLLYDVFLGLHCWIWLFSQYHRQFPLSGCYFMRHSIGLILFVCRKGTLFSFQIVRSSFHVSLTASVIWHVLNVLKVNTVTGKDSGLCQICLNLSVRLVCISYRWWHIRLMKLFSQ